MVKVGDCFVTVKGLLFKVIGIIDENYCICHVKIYKSDGYSYGNWSQSIKNIESALKFGLMKKLTLAEIVLYEN